MVTKLCKSRASAHVQNLSFHESEGFFSALEQGRRFILLGGIEMHITIDTININGGIFFIGIALILTLWLNRK